MPPVMMTKVQAMARTPLTAVACRMPSMLSVCMKAGEAKLKKTSSRIRLAKASSFCTAVGPKSRARKAEASPLLAKAAASDRIVIALALSCSRRFQGFALGRQLHDPLLRGVASKQFAGDAALAHDDDPVAHAQDLRQFR